MVGGASEEFVERVFEEYGDPAADSRDEDDEHQADTAGETVMTDGSKPVAADSPGNPSPGSDPDPGIADEDDEVTTLTDADRAVGTEHEHEHADERTGARESDTQDSSEKRDTPDRRGSNARERSDTNGRPTGSGGERGPKPVTDPSSLNDRQRATLRAVHQDPTATQQEIAETLDVTRATVSKRVNDIPGFDWDDRRAFVEQLYGSDASAGAGGDGSGPAVGDLESRVSALERRVDSDGGSDLDPALLHKTIHACMDADHFSEQEELELLRQLL